MRWLRRLFMGTSSSAPAGGSAGPSTTAAPVPGDPGDPVTGAGLSCLTCGNPLGLDAEDEPTGDAGGPICGECNRARNFDVLFET